MPTKNPRIQVMPSDELKDWFQFQAKEMGISMSGLIAVAMTQYRQQSQALNSMQGLPAIMDELKKIQIRQEKFERESKKNA